MAKTFEVLDIFNTFENGWVLLCSNDESLKVGTKVRINGNEYIIEEKKDISPMQCLLTLSPNEPVMYVELGNIIEIIK